MRADLQALAAVVRAPPGPRSRCSSSRRSTFGAISDPVTQQPGAAAVDQMRAASSRRPTRWPRRIPFEHTLGILERAGKLFHPKDDGGTATALVR